MLKKLRSIVWLTSGLIQRYRQIIIFGFIAGLSLFLIFQHFAPWLSKELKREHTVMGFHGFYTPTNLPIEIQKLVSTGLTEVSIEGEVRPGLATEWKVDTTGKEYLFTLKDDVYWHDDTKFTAFDVNYNFKDVDIEPLSDTQLKMTLKEPFVPLTNFVTRPLFKKNLIGVGPYRIDTISLKGQNVSYLRFSPTDSRLPKLEVKFYPSQSSLKTAFKLGEVTTIDGLTDPAPFTDWSTVEVLSNVRYNQYIAIFFNLNQPHLQERALRQALAYAIDKPWKHRIASPISSQSWAYTNQVKQFEEDISEAKELVDQIELDKPIQLATFLQNETLAKDIAGQWQEIGIDTNIEVVESIPADYEALLVTQEIQPDPDQYPLWHSTQIDTNITHYANPKIDKLLEDGRKELDARLRKEIYFDFQRYLVEDVPAIFLYHPVTYSVSRK